MSLEVLYRRIGEHALGETEREQLARSLVGPRHYHRGDPIVEQGEQPKHLHLVVSGWAIECHSRTSGARQITNFYLPGDLCNLPALALCACPKIEALTQVSTVLLDRSILAEAVSRTPRMAHAILRIAVSGQASMRMWIAGMGRRNGREHLAHLICELHSRMRRAGLADSDELALPMTQQDLADATGMSPVHVNRVLQALRREHLLEGKGGRYRIPQPEKLRELAEFDDAYLLE